jgi:TolB protein
LIKPSEGAGQPIQLAVDGFDPRWSPDGGKLAFLRQSGTLTTLWTVEPLSGAERQLTPNGVVTRGFSRLPYNRIQPPDYAWSPDNNKIAFCSNRSGQQGIYVLSTDTLSETKISGEPKNTETFFSPRWSPDGKRVAYISLQRAPSAETKPVWSVWIAGREPELVFQSSTTVRLMGWSSSGDDVIIGVAEDNNALTVTVSDMRVLQVSAGGGQRMIAPLKSTYFMNVQLSPDARTIGFVSRQDGRDNIWTIPTSGGEAKKITANPDPRLYFSSLAWSPDGKAIYYGKQSKWGLISMIDNFK